MEIGRITQLVGDGKPLVVATREQLAYLAGFFDGEGSVWIARPGRRGFRLYVLNVSIVNTKPEPLRLIHSIFGGYLYFRDNASRRDKNASPSFQWRAAHGTAYTFLRSILPYLIIKKATAEIGILFQENKKSFKNGFGGIKYRKGQTSIPPEELAFREDCRSSIQKLNRRGRIIHEAEAIVAQTT